MASIYNTILWLRSRSTGKQIPVALFSADTDLATDGRLSLTSTTGPEVVVTCATPKESRAIMGGPDGYSLCEERVNAALQRADFRCCWLLDAKEVAARAERPPANAQPLFQPQLLYRDIFAANSTAVEVGRVSATRFRRAGGKPLVLK